jgi:hypothetical protein
MKTIGIIQSGYVPWSGYLDFIDEVDTFLFLEDVQYIRRDWRSMNRIKTRARAGNKATRAWPMRGGACTIAPVYRDRSLSDLG